MTVATIASHVTIPMVNNEVRVVMRPDGTILAYVVKQQVPIQIRHSMRREYDALVTALQFPQDANSKTVVTEFVTYLKDNNDEALANNVPNRLAIFKDMLSEEQTTFLIGGVSPQAGGGYIPQSVIQRGGLLRELYNDLAEGLVFLTFRKASTGEARQMICTRNADIIRTMHNETATDTTSPSARVTNPERINVFSLDAYGFRSFYVSAIFPQGSTEEDVLALNREGFTAGHSHGLMWYKLTARDASRFWSGNLTLEDFLSDKYGELVQAQSDVNAISWTEDNYPLATAQYTVQQMVEVLRTKVVRVQLETSNGLRVMYATRKPDIISIYEPVGKILKEVEDARTEQEKMDEILERRQISVFDISIQDFRTLAVDKILDKDSTQPVPSWIEYDVDTGDWYATMRGTRLVTETYSGQGFAGKDMLVIDRERLRFEGQQFKYQAVKVDVLQQLAQDSSHIDRINETNLIVAAALEQLKGTHTSQDLEAFEVFKGFKERLEEDFKARMLEGRVGSTLILSEAKATLRDHLVTLTFNWGRDVIYIHPRFIVSASSHKVWADRTTLFETGLPRARPSSTDKALENILEKLSPLVTGRRRADLFTKAIEGDDVRRVRRILQLVKAHKVELKEAGIGITQTKDLQAQFKVSIDRKQFVLMNHEYVYDLANKGFVFIRTKETTYANMLEPLIAGKEGAEYQVLTLLLQACDLRRSVLDDGGNPL